MTLLSAVWHATIGLGFYPELLDDMKIGFGITYHIIQSNIMGGYNLFSTNTKTCLCYKVNILYA